MKGRPKETAKRIAKEPKQHLRKKTNSNTGQQERCRQANNSRGQGGRHLGSLLVKERGKRGTELRKENRVRKGEGGVRADVPGVLEDLGGKFRETLRPKTTEKLEHDRE